MSNVKFNYFLKNNPNNKRELPIVMTIIMSGERTQMFTGLWTVKSKWNQKYSKVIGTDPDSKSINDTLLSFISRGRRVVNELVVSGKPFNPNTVKDKLKNRIRKKRSAFKSIWSAKSQTILWRCQYQNSSCNSTVCTYRIIDL